MKIPMDKSLLGYAQEKI